jgi:hypothetical protein
MMASSMSMTNGVRGIAVHRPSAETRLRAVCLRNARCSRSLKMRLNAAVQYDYTTNVFQKELVKFADTEEYIYRCEMRSLDSYFTFEL